MSQYDWSGSALGKDPVDDSFDQRCPGYAPVSTTLQDYSESIRCTNGCLEEQRVRAQNLDLRAEEAAASTPPDLQIMPRQGRPAKPLGDPRSLHHDYTEPEHSVRGQAATFPVAMSGQTWSMAIGLMSSMRPSINPEFRLYFCLSKFSHSVHALRQELRHESAEFTRRALWDSCSQGLPPMREGQSSMRDRGRR